MHLDLERREGHFFAVDRDVTFRRERCQTIRFAAVVAHVLVEENFAFRCPVEALWTREICELFQRVSDVAWQLTLSASMRDDGAMTVKSIKPLSAEAGGNSMACVDVMSAS